MSVPTTSVGFSRSTPAAPDGFQIAQPQSDGGTPQQLIDMVVPNTGGVAVKTADYTLTAADCGKLIVANSASAITFTLPAAVPFAQWQAKIANIGAGALSVAPGSLTLDGAAATLAVAQFQSLSVAADGSNYFSARGLGSAAGSGGGISDPTTTEGDLIVRGVSALGRLAAGTSGDVLTSNGPGTLPSYQPGTSGGGLPFWPVTAAPPPVSAFAWVNQLNATLTASGSLLSAVAPTPAAALTNLRLLVQSIPSSPYTLTAGILAQMPTAGAPCVGLVLRESASGEFVDLVALNNAGTPGIYAQKFNSPTSFNSTYASLTSSAGTMNSVIYLRIQDDGTNRILFWSPDGVFFFQLFSVSRTDFITPDQLGLVLAGPTSTSNAPTSATLFSWVVTQP